MFRFILFSTLYFLFSHTMAEDYYAMLGVSKTANEEEIKRAYRRLAQQYHPDRKGGDEQKFKKINEAYQVLSHKEKRAQYDRFGHAFSGGAPGAGQGFSGFEGFDVNFDNFNFGDMGDISDIFESFFGGLGGKKRKTYTRGSDLQVMQNITLEEAYKGMKKHLDFELFVSCATCNGMGYFGKEGTKTCEACNGRGEVKEVRRSFFGNFQQIRSCEKCFGSGQIPNKVCSACKGKGRVKQSKTVNVEILPGVLDGQLIKITGAGEAGERGAATGDLYVQVRIQPHKTFKRQGDDLLIVKEISPLAILLGKKIEIPTLSGEKIWAEIPAGFNLSEQLRVPGRGMPHFGSSAKLTTSSHSHGDLYVKFEIRAPKKVSHKAKKIFEDLEGEIE